MFKTNFEIQELRLPPYFEWETKKSLPVEGQVPVWKFLEIHPKYTSVYCSKAMLDGWKLEFLNILFSIQEYVKNSEIRLLKVEGKKNSGTCGGPI